MSQQTDLTQVLEEAASHAEMGEVYELRSDELPVTFRSGELESIRSMRTTGRALRVIDQGRLGFSTTTDLTDDRTVVENALASARYGDPVAFEFPPPQNPTAVACFDSGVERMDEKALIEMGQEAVARLGVDQPDLQIDVSLVKRIDRVRLVNTAGLDDTFVSTTLSVSLDITRTRGDDILILWRTATARRREDIDLSAMVDHLAERLRWCERTARIEARPMPVVFKSAAVPTLLLPLLLGLNGRNVYLGTSPLGNRLGEAAFDERLTLTDDGRLDYGARSAPFDDEGVPTRTNGLVTQGTVAQFLYDLRTAGQAGTEPTGNGFKSSGLFGGGYEDQPSVAPANWLLAPGDSSLDDILEGLDEALLVEGLIGMGQGNILAGEFSNNVGAGYLMRRGEVVGRVKNTMIAGNVYELLRDNVLALSDEREQVFGAFTTPAIVIDSVSVVGS
jgi:PmbA protein